MSRSYKARKPRRKQPQHKLFDWSEFSLHLGTVSSKRKRYRRCTSVPYNEGPVCDGYSACDKKTCKKCIFRHKARDFRNRKPKYGDDWKKVEE